MADQDSDEPGLTPPPETAATTSLHYSLLGPSLLKSGQDGVDQKKVGEIIYNASKGSRFFKHEEKRDEKVPFETPESTMED
jgi:DNA polymerase kappa